MKKYVAYYRVSTAKQGQSGLGLQAQKNAVLIYTGRGFEVVGNSASKPDIQSTDYGEIIAEFTEVETGTRKKKRVEIYKAIELAKKEKAVLIVAKLDRLARNVEFTSALYNGGVEFICCDNPNANKLTIQLLSVFAENEADIISRRIKDALQVKKQQIDKGKYTNKDGSKMKPINGVYRLGNPNDFSNYQKLGVEKIKENAKNNKANLQAMDIICSARNEGLTYQQIADKLNRLQYTTRYKKKFNPIQVQRLYIKCEAIS